MKFFRKIRESLLAEKRIGRYLLYALGEIILVVIGILIALQINNRNEARKQRQVEKKAYVDLLSSLRKDAAEVSDILLTQKRSSTLLQQIISTTTTEIRTINSADSLNQILLFIYSGSRSFFPKYGTYNSIVANKGLDLISSEEIKSNLIDLYDYQYNRYQFIDRVLDDKYMNSFVPFIQEKLGFYLNNDLTLQSIDTTVFFAHYQALQQECKNLGPMTRNSTELLKRMSESVDSLVLAIETKLEEFD